MNQPPMPILPSVNEAIVMTPCVVVYMDIHDANLNTFPGPLSPRPAFDTGAGYHVNNNAFLKYFHVDSDAEDIQRLTYLASELRSFQGELEEVEKYVNYILFKRYQIWRNHPHLPNTLASMVKGGRTGTNQYAVLREQYQRLDSYTRRAESWMRVREDRRQRDREIRNDIAELKKTIDRRIRGLQYKLEDQKKAFEGIQDFINGDEPMTG